jgi:hypothetical protein
MTAAAATARRLSAAPTAISDHAIACDAWLMAGEVLARAGNLADARRCFAKILGHRMSRRCYEANEAGDATGDTDK